MAISQEQVQEQLDKGFNVFCATCVHHHDGLAKGLPSCIQSTQTCAGPLRGMEFPDYLGPIPRERFFELCLICGDPSPFLKIITNSKPVFSLCKKHRRALLVLPNKYVTWEPKTIPV